MQQKKSIGGNGIHLAHNKKIDNNVPCTGSNSFIFDEFQLCTGGVIRIDGVDLHGGVEDLNERLRRSANGKLRLHVKRAAHGRPSSSMPRNGGPRGGGSGRGAHASQFAGSRMWPGSKHEVANAARNRRRLIARYQREQPREAGSRSDLVNSIADETDSQSLS